MFGAVLRFFPFFLCLWVFGIHQQASAQNGERVAYYLRFKTIDTAYLKCEYRYAFVDSGKTDTHLMVLLVGNKVQKFQGDDDYQSDSLAIIFDNKPHQVSYFRSREKGVSFNRSNVKWKVYLGYPEGKVSIADRVFIDNYISEELLESIQWKINEDSVKNLMGYDCIQAECDCTVVTGSCGMLLSWLAHQVRGSCGAYLGSSYRPTTPSTCTTSSY